MEDIWSSFKVGFDVRQEYDSRKTSRKQLARCLTFCDRNSIFHDGLIVFDFGCGRFNEQNKKVVESVGAKYLCCDLYNKTVEDNIANITMAQKEKADVVILSNLLNVIKEESVRATVLRQSKDLLATNGLLLISIYEGRPLSSEQKSKGVLLPVRTKDGWQNRMKTEMYIDEVRAVYPCVELVTEKGSSSKYIIGTLDTGTMELKLSLFKNIKDRT